MTRGEIDGEMWENGWRRRFWIQANPGTKRVGTRVAEFVECGLRVNPYPVSIYSKRFKSFLTNRADPRPTLYIYQLDSNVLLSALPRRQKNPRIPSRRSPFPRSVPPSAHASSRQRTAAQRTTSCHG
jgi:hypothetical protein